MGRKNERDCEKQEKSNRVLIAQSRSLADVHHRSIIDPCMAEFSGRAFRVRGKVIRRRRIVTKDGRKVCAECCVHVFKL